MFYDNKYKVMTLLVSRLDVDERKCMLLFTNLPKQRGLQTNRFNVYITAHTRHACSGYYHKPVQGRLANISCSLIQ